MGRPYTLYKLRTMKRDAEKKEPNGRGRKTSGSPGVGNSCAKWRVDEIPPVFGRRQGRDVHSRSPSRETGISGGTDQKRSARNCRHLVKPGLTGWAQIRFRYASGVDDSEEKLSFDLY